MGVVDVGFRQIDWYHVLDYGSEGEDESSKVFGREGGGFGIHH